MTFEETLYRLAVQTKLCENGHYPDVGVPEQANRGFCSECGVPFTCDVPGNVYLFPRLRETCPGDFDGFIHPAHSNVISGEVCKVCQGRTWVLVATLDVLVAAAHSVDLDVTVKRPVPVYPKYIAELCGARTYMDVGPTAQEALARALLQATTGVRW